MTRPAASSRQPSIAKASRPAYGGYYRVADRLLVAASNAGQRRRAQLAYLMLERSRVKLEVKQLGSHWWILGDEDAGPMGPYNSRGDAEEDRRGVLRFHRFVIQGKDLGFLHGIRDESISISDRGR